MNPYFTHQEYLIKEIKKLNFKENVHILEFGAGDGSGLVFKHYTDKYQNLTVDAYEHELEWYKTCKANYESENYKFHLIDWKTLDYTNLKTKKYDLIFVDQGIWEERTRTVEQMQNYANVIIVHDFDYYNKNLNCTDIYGVDDTTYWGEKYNKNFTLQSFAEVLPPTLVMKRI